MIITQNEYVLLIFSRGASLKEEFEQARSLAYHYAPKKGSSLNMAEIDRTAARCISMLCVLIPFMKASRSGRSKNENDVLQRHPI